MAQSSMRSGRIAVQACGLHRALQDRCRQDPRPGPKSLLDLGDIQVVVTDHTTAGNDPLSMKRSADGTCRGEIVRPISTAERSAPTIGHDGLLVDP